MGQMQQMMEKMALIIQATTGQDLLGQPQQPPEQGGERPKTGQRPTLGSAQKAAQKGTMTDYGQALAARAKPSVGG
jgi:hypothetical protein